MVAFGLPTLDTTFTTFKPCARTAPQAVLSMVAFVEKCGNVAKHSCLATDVAVHKAFDQVTMLLAEGTAPPKKANMFPLSVV